MVFKHVPHYRYKDRGRSSLSFRTLLRRFPRRAGTNQKGTAHSGSATNGTVPHGSHGNVTSVP